MTSIKGWKILWMPYKGGPGDRKKPFTRINHPKRQLSISCYCWETACNNTEQGLWTCKSKQIQTLKKTKSWTLTKSKGTKTQEATASEFSVILQDRCGLTLFTGRMNSRSPGRIRVVSEVVKPTSSRVILVVSRMSYHYPEIWDMLLIMYNPPDYELLDIKKETDRWLLS